MLGRPILELRIVVGMSGILIFFTSILAAIDVVFYKGELVFGDWGSNSEMALPTAFCLMLTGNAFLIIATTNRFWGIRS